MVCREYLLTGVLKVEFMKFCDVQDEQLQITSGMTIYYVLLIINVFVNIIYGYTGSKLDITYIVLYRFAFIVFHTVLFFTLLY